MKKWIYGIVGTLFFAMAIGSGIAIALTNRPSKAPVEEVEYQKIEHQKVENEKEENKGKNVVNLIYDIGIVENQFRSTYNKMISKRNEQFVINKNKSHVENEVETYEVSFNKSLAMMVCSHVNNGMIKGIVLSSEAKNISEWRQMHLVVSALLDAVEPGISNQQKTDLLNRLNLPSENIDISKKDYEGLKNLIEYNNKTYILYGTKGLSLCVLGKDIIFDINDAKNNPNTSINLVIDILAYDQWLRNNSIQGNDNRNQKMSSSQAISKWIAVVERYDREIDKLVEECNSNPSKERAKKLREKANDIDSRIYSSIQEMIRDDYKNIPEGIYDGAPVRCSKYR